MTLPWAGSSSLLAISALRNPGLAVETCSAMAEPVLIPVFRLAELVSIYLWYCAARLLGVKKPTLAFALKSL